MKRGTKPGLNVKSFHAAKNVLACIGFKSMVCKEQRRMDGSNTKSFAEPLYTLAVKIRQV